MSAETTEARLVYALQIISKEKLLLEVMTLCEKIPEAQDFLFNRLLVKGKDVHRYHSDIVSEIDGDSIDRDAYEIGLEDRNTKEAASRSDQDLVAIAIADDELTPRYVKCLNCKKEFDVANNENRTCIWHTGKKIYDDENDFWADHDENCDGRIDDLEDVSDYAEGFVWECCRRYGDDEGCKFTKHKAEVNLLLYYPAAEGGKRSRENGQMGFIPSKKTKV